MCAVVPLGLLWLLGEDCLAAIVAPAVGATLGVLGLAQNSPSTTFRQLKANIITTTFITRLK